MQEHQGLDEGLAEAPAMSRGEGNRLFREGTHTALPDAFRDRIHRRQAVGERRRGPCQHAVFRVIELCAAGACPHLPKAPNPGALAQLHLLLAREVEQAHGDDACAVRDTRKQATAPAEHHIRGCDLSLHHDRSPGARRADRRQTRSILVAQRQMKEQVLNAANAQTSELFRERASHAAERSDRVGQRGAVFGMRSWFFRSRHGYSW